MAVILSTDMGSLTLNTEFPTGISFTKSANWESVSTIARWAPVYGYSSSASLRITLNIRLSLDYDPPLPVAVFLIGLTYPNYLTNAYKPPTVSLKIENWPKIDGHVDSVTVSVPDDAAWVDGIGPSVIDCQVGIVEDTRYLPIEWALGGAGDNDRK
jgi:hypothetical protein